ncbi:hypothetical protein GCM10022206_85110 [Streptomyces chiangmaiensis]
MKCQSYASEAIHHDLANTALPHTIYTAPQLWPRRPRPSAIVQERLRRVAPSLAPLPSGLGEADQALAGEGARDSPSFPMGPATSRRDGHETGTGLFVPKELVRVADHGPVGLSPDASGHSRPRLSAAVRRHCDEVRHSLGRRPGA